MFSSPKRTSFTPSIKLPEIHKPKSEDKEYALKSILSEVNKGHNSPKEKLQFIKNILSSIDIIQDELNKNFGLDSNRIIFKGDVIAFLNKNSDVKIFLTIICKHTQILPSKTYTNTALSLRNDLNKLKVSLENQIQNNSEKEIRYKSISDEVWEKGRRNLIHSNLTSIAKFNRKQIKRSMEYLRSQATKVKSFEIKSTNIKDKITVLQAGIFPEEVIKEENE